MGTGSVSLKDLFILLLSSYSSLVDDFPLCSLVLSFFSLSLSVIRDFGVQDIRPSQPLTSNLDFSIGDANKATNELFCDIVTFHCFDGPSLRARIMLWQEHSQGRPVLCAGYMAREKGTTFEVSLPLFKEFGVGCLCSGLVAGRSQTIWNWQTVHLLKTRREAHDFLQPGSTEEPPLWFYDIYRTDGSPFSPAEVEFIRATMGVHD